MELLSFKQYCEAATVLGRIDGFDPSLYARPKKIDGVTVSSHALDRIKERFPNFNIDSFNEFFKQAADKAKKVGEYLFVSNKTGRAFIGIVKNIGNIIVKTVLPPKSAGDYFAKSGTGKIVVENKSYQIIEVD